MDSAAWIALAAVVFAGLNIWIADRKLSLDLFHLRYAAYSAWREAQAAYAAAMEEWEDDRGEDDRYQKMVDFFHAGRRMAPLFGPRIMKRVAEINEQFEALFESKSLLLELPPEARGPRLGLQVMPEQRRVISDLSELSKMRDRLNDAVAPILRQETVPETIRRWLRMG